MKACIDSLGPSTHRAKAQIPTPCSMGVTSRHPPTQSSLSSRDSGALGLGGPLGGG